MKKRIRRWFFFKKVELVRKLSSRKKAVSFEKVFKRNVFRFAKSLSFQFGERSKVKVSFEKSKAYLTLAGYVIAEVEVYKKSELHSPAYIVVRTTIEPMPRWWIGQAFAGMKWTAAGFAKVPQLMHVKPREP